MRAVIVNADDWGYDLRTTDRIRDVIDLGVVSSTTAMLHMSDSRRAATLAAEIPGAGIGLHLNLDEPLSGDDVPPDVRRRHEAVMRLVSHRRARWVADPRAQRLLDAVVADQWTAFEALYGRPPTHVDGHHHLHMLPGVLRSASLPHGVPVRRTRPNRKPGRLHAAARGVRWTLTARRVTHPAGFVDLRALTPELGAPASASPHDLPGNASTPLEVMVHPGLDDEFAYLRSEAWRDAVQSVRLVAFAR